MDKTPRSLQENSPSQEKELTITTNSPGNVMKICEMLSRKTFYFKVIGKSRIRYTTGLYTRMAFIDFVAQEKVYKCTLYDKVVDKFYDVIQINKIYALRNIFLQPTQKNYNAHNSPGEIVLMDDTSIEEIDENEIKKHDFQYNFNVTQLSTIGSIAENSIINIKVKVLEILPQTKQVMPNGTEVKRQDIILEDVVSGKITFKMWNSLFTHNVNDILVITNVKVKIWKSMPYINATPASSFYIQNK